MCAYKSMRAYYVKRFCHFVSFVILQMSLVRVLLVDSLCFILEQNSSSSLLISGSTQETDIT